MRQHKLEIQSTDNSNPNTDNFRLIVVRTTSHLYTSKQSGFFSTGINCSLSLLGRLCLRASVHCQRCVARRVQVRHHELQQQQPGISLCGDVWQPLLYQPQGGSIPHSSEEVVLLYDSVIGIACTGKSDLALLVSGELHLLGLCKLPRLPRLVSSCTCRLQNMSLTKRLQKSSAGLSPTLFLYCPDCQTLPGRSSRYSWLRQLAPCFPLQ